MGVRKWLRTLQLRDCQGTVEVEDEHDNQMFDVTNHNAQHAIYSVSNWLASQVPMPSPNGPKNHSGSKGVDKSTADFGQRLAKKRSQDFATKIQGWNSSGAGVAQQDDEVVVVEEVERDREVKQHEVPTPKDERKKRKQAVAEVVMEVDDDAALARGNAVAMDVGDASPTTPKTPASKPGATSRTPTSMKPTKELEVNLKTTKELDVGRQAWVRRKSKPQAEISAEVKEAVAPKKRVVSDGHWRRDKPLPNNETATPEKDKEKETTPKLVTIRRSVASVGFKVPPSVQDFVEIEPEPVPVRVRPLRRSNSRSRSRSRERQATPDYEDSGVKVYIKRRRRPTTDAKKDARTSESSFTGGSSFDRPSTVSTDITTPSASPRKATPPRPLSAPKERAVRRSLEAVEAQQRVSRHRSQTPAESPMASKPSKSPVGLRASPRESPKPALDPVIPPLPRVYGTRIEGWLAGTPDPFGSEGDDSTRAPERRTAMQKTFSADLDSESLDSQDEVSQTRRKSSAQKRRSRRSLESVSATDRSIEATLPRNISSEPSAAASPTLKRAGATRTAHSPIKERSHRERRPTVNATTEKYPSTLASIDKDTHEFRARTRPHDARSDASDHRTIIPEGSVLSRASDGDDPRKHATGLKRRLTKHSDLISVLSLSRDETPGLVSARSIRTRRAKAGPATIGDLMNEVTTDELKYQRELRTLVDGVIPVLLTHVLQKSGSSGTRRLFSGPMTGDSAVTAPIVEMGVALERLKSMHKRIPMHNAGELLAWGEGASKAYGAYLRAWRLGFQDIVVNLAPAEESNNKDSSPGWDHDLQRDKSGDLLSGDGDRVDVAYLLKRPLVRLKCLVKTFKGFEQVLPLSSAKDMAAIYQELVEMARKRSNDERARLEDEAAASIDPTRARDPQSLALLSGVSIDPTRTVRARDYFDLDLLHTSGQQMGCKIEVIIRDDAPERGTTSDLLFCEVSTTGRWLLYPPILASNVSARKSEKDGEIIVMLRGVLGNGRAWRELMSLQSEDDNAVTEWLEMLPSQPVPSSLSKQSSFNALRGVPADRAHTSGTLPTTAESPREVEVPIGERAMPTSMKWDGSEVNSVIEDEPAMLRRSRAKRHQSTPSIPLVDETHRRIQGEYVGETRSDSEKHAYGSASKNHGPSRSRHTRSTTDWTAAPDVSTPRKDYNVWLPPSEPASDGSSADEDDRPSPARPDMHRRTSSVPSMQLPAIPKLRKASQPLTPRRDARLEHEVTSAEGPSTAPAKLQKRRPDLSKYESQKEPEPERSSRQAAYTPSKPVGAKSSMFTSFTPAFLKRTRRSSSPLKHQYEPSTASESSNESDFSDVNDAESVTSESSAGEEAVSTIGELRNFSNIVTMRPTSKPPAPKSDFSMSGGSLRPSESASQAPFRHVPAPQSEPAKTVACIFSWSDRGSWDSLHPEECSIIVTPGLIEAFDLAQAHAVAPQAADAENLSPSARGVKPLVALELTPLVPLRRGTALDISIRSPPTANSVIRTGNNVMFRSRSPEECEKLYHLINRARIDNPTYIALQNARGPPRSNWAEVMDQNNVARTKGSSWLRFGSRKSSTYRSNGSRPTSIAATESSVGTMNSAFSALRRFSGSNNIFNIAKSTLTSKEGTRSTYSDSLSSGAATPMPIDPNMGTPLGITNAKVRLYIRETASKWRDMGSARLTVMLPPRQDVIAAANPKATGLGKRIILCGKSKGETLLDVTLGESAFERVARTGIAVSVWEEMMGPNGELGHVAARGGVVGSSSKVYMIQMKSVSAGACSKSF